MRAPSLSCVAANSTRVPGRSGRCLDEMVTILPKRPRITATVAWLIGGTGNSVGRIGCRRSASHRPRIRIGARAMTPGFRFSAAIDHKDKSPTMQDIAQQGYHDFPEQDPP